MEVRSTSFRTTQKSMLSWKLPRTLQPSQCLGYTFAAEVNLQVKFQDMAGSRVYVIALILFHWVLQPDLIFLLSSFGVREFHILVYCLKREGSSNLARERTKSHPMFAWCFWHHTVFALSNRQHWTSCYIHPHCLPPMTPVLFG